MTLMALAAAAFALAAGGPPAACRNTLVEEVFAPGGQLKAALYLRQCEAGPAKEVHVSILPITAILADERGNAFVGEARGPDLFDPKTTGVSLTWLNPGELSILHGPIVMRRAAGRVRGVRLYYGHLVDAPLDLMPGPSRP